MKRLLILALGTATALAAGAAQAEPTYEALNRVLTDKVAVPAYERMAAAMAGLDNATAAFCKAPDAPGLDAVEAAFRDAMGAWQRAQPIAFGPASWDGRAARIQFWPDKGGTAARQVRRALEAQDPALVADGGLDGKSVALQNLATYERIVFSRGAQIASEQAGEADRYACALASAIARFQAALSAEILDDWVGPGGFREAVHTAGRGNEHFLDAKEAATAYLKSLSGTLDAAVRLKLEPPLGRSAESARPKRAESWRSGQSLANIRANLETARALFALPGGFGELLGAAGAGALETGMRKSFDEVVSLAGSVGMPLRAAVSDPAARARVEVLLDKLRGLRLLVAGPLGQEIGLMVGFNALDGD